MAMVPFCSLVPDHTLLRPANFLRLTFGGGEAGVRERTAVWMYICRSTESRDFAC